MISLMVDWFKEEGGVEVFEKRSLAKSQLLYDIIDEDEFYTNKVRKEDRSTMNVIFRINQGDEELEKLFVEKAKDNGIVGVKGHRIAGGMRISLYNAVTLESVEVLASFMRDFKEKYS
jgi:phosphoserine aminotransferase